MLFLWTEGRNAKEMHKNMSCLQCLSRKAVHVRKSQMTPNQVRTWPRQQPEHFYAAGFDAMVKRWDTRINVDGRYMESKMFSPDSNITCFTFYFRL
jgi:hypothetical protein